MRQYSAVKSSPDQHTFYLAPSTAFHLCKQVYRPTLCSMWNKCHRSITLGKSVTIRPFIRPWILPEVRKITLIVQCSNQNKFPTTAFKFWHTQLVVCKRSITRNQIQCPYSLPVFYVTINSEHYTLIFNFCPIRTILSQYPSNQNVCLSHTHDHSKCRQIYHY